MNKVTQTARENCPKIRVTDGLTYKMMTIVIMPARPIATIKTKTKQKSPVQPYKPGILIMHQNSILEFFMENNIRFEVSPETIQ